MQTGCSFFLSLPSVQSQPKSSLLRIRPEINQLATQPFRTRASRLILGFVSAANLVIPVHIVPSSGPRPANQEPWKNSQRPRLVLCRGTEKITAEPVQSQSQGAAWPTTQQCFSPGQRHHRAQLCTEVGGVLLLEAKRKQQNRQRRK